MILRTLAAIFLALASPAAALELTLPATAQLTVERVTEADTYSAPTGPFADGAVSQLKIEGRVARRAWRILSGGLTPLQVIGPLRTQLSDAGYDILLDCADRACGGFDFRFAAEVLPGPNMYVNLRAYHFVTGVRRAPDGRAEEVITFLASTTGAAAFLQIVEAGRQAAVQVAPAPAEQAAPEVSSDLVSALLEQGHVVLGDLDFDTGSTALGPGPFESLSQIAAFLGREQEARIALVGHTDAVGGLEGNIGISRARARAVEARLIEAYGIDPERLDAAGMGYLAPLASNLTPEGREQNRRVEVVLLGLE